MKASQSLSKGLSNVFRRSFDGTSTAFFKGISKVFQHPKKHRHVQVPLSSERYLSKSVQVPLSSERYPAIVEIYWIFWLMICSPKCTKHMETAGPTTAFRKSFDGLFNAIQMLFICPSKAFQMHFPCISNVFRMPVVSI